MIQDGLPRIERVSEVDRLLIIRMEARVADLQRTAQELQSLVTGHLSTVYTLRPGDRVDDAGRIVRTALAGEDLA